MIASACVCPPVGNVGACVGTEEGAKVGAIVAKVGAGVGGMS